MTVIEVVPFSNNFPSAVFLDIQQEEKKSIHGLLRAFSAMVVVVVVVVQSS